MKKKKSSLEIIGLLALLIGVGAIVYKLASGISTNILPWSGGLIGVGISVLITERKLRDREYAIEASSKDERAVMLREKAGQITNIILFVSLSILTVVLIVANAETWIVITIWCLAALQLVLFHLLYRLLSKKY